MPFVKMRRLSVFAKLFRLFTFPLRDKLLSLVPQKIVVSKTQVVTQYQPTILIVG